MTQPTCPRLVYEQRYLELVIDESALRFPSALPPLQLALSAPAETQCAGIHEVVQLFLDNISSVALFGVMLGAGAQAGSKALELATADVYGWLKDLLVSMTKHNADPAERRRYGAENRGIRMCAWSPERAAPNAGLTLDITITQELNSNVDPVVLDAQLDYYVGVLRPALQMISNQSGIERAIVQARLGVEDKPRWMCHAKDCDGQVYSFPTMCVDEQPDWDTGNPNGCRVLRNVLTKKAIDATVTYHVTGDLHQYGQGANHVEDKRSYSSTTTNSPGAATAQGDGASATTFGSGEIPQAPSQEEHRKNITDTQAALVRDQDAVADLGAGVYEALGQFLTIARKIQVDHHDLKRTQVQMKDTLDEVWAQQAAKELRSPILPKTLEVATALAKNPVMQEVAKKLIAGL